MYGTVCPVGVFVDFRVADAGKAADALQPGTEPADAGKHVEKSNHILSGHGMSPFLLHCVAPAA